MTEYVSRFNLISEVFRHRDGVGLDCGGGRRTKEIVESGHELAEQIILVRQRAGNEGAAVQELCEKKRAVDPCAIP